MGGEVWVLEKEDGERSGAVKEAAKAAVMGAAKAVAKQAASVSEALPVEDASGTRAGSVVGMESKEVLQGFAAVELQDRSQARLERRMGPGFVTNQRVAVVEGWRDVLEEGVPMPERRMLVEVEQMKGLEEKVAQGRQWMERDQVVEGPMS